jgi:hypothetical protein
VVASIAKAAETDLLIVTLVSVLGLDVDESLHDKK